MKKMMLLVALCGMFTLTVLVSCDDGKKKTCDDDGICDSGETFESCPADCGQAACDDDGTCDAGETFENCPGDCPAAACDDDGTCDAGETFENCPGDCCPTQVFDGDVTITDAASVLAAAAYTRITGDLTVDSGSALLDLTGLECLTEVGGNFHASFVAGMTSLEGLQNLTRIGGQIGIYDNSVLASFDGLRGLQRVVDLSSVDLSFNGYVPCQEAVDLVDRLRAVCEAETGVCCTATAMLLFTGSSAGTDDCTYPEVAAQCL